MNLITRVIGDTTFTFRVTVEQDTDSGAPWENEDGHGPVSEWVTRDKRPGELVLNTDRNSKRFYDFAEACRQALAGGWDAKPYNTGAETKRQQAAKAARANFEHLRGWIVGDWTYNGVTVTVLDEDGEDTDVTSSLWGVDDCDPNYPQEVAADLIAELVDSYGKAWGKVAKETFARIPYLPTV